MGSFAIDEDSVPAGVPRSVLTSGRVAAIVSLIAHVAIASVSIVVVTRGREDASRRAPTERTYPLPDPEVPVVIELPSASADPTGPSAAEPKPADPLQPLTASGAKVPRADEQKQGKGGESTVSAKAVNLAAHAEDRTTAEEVRDAIDDEQENRLLTAKKRESRIDFRRALEPMELTFVASGKGFRYERHPLAKAVASLGAPGAAGAKAGVASLPVDGVASDLKPFGPLGAASPSPPKGAAYGQPLVGVPQIVGGNSAKGRPHVGKGKPSIESDQKGVPKDTIDSDQAVATALKSVVSNSTAGGATVAQGTGGTAGGGAPGAGGSSGTGSSNVALGEGNGALDAPHDVKRTRWYLELQKRLRPLVAGTFPKEQELELRNGTVIVDLVIAKGGSVLDVIVVRPSGFATFDQNVVTRIRGAGTLEPIPDVLGSGAITVRVPVTGGWTLQ